MVALIKARELLIIGAVPVKHMITMWGPPNLYMNPTLYVQPSIIKKMEVESATNM